MTDWAAEISRVWKDYVRYIAIGGMLVGAFYTLFKMRKSLTQGIARSLSTLGKSARPARAPKPFRGRTATSSSSGPWPTALSVAVLVFFIFNGYAGSLPASLVAVLLMIVLGFVFAAVSGYLVGIIGVSSNPTSGLTVSVLIIVAFVMVLMGLKGGSGISAVLIVAAFTCVSVSVAGEMMQDLKAGHILGCTPRRMQIGDIFGVTAAVAGRCSSSCPSSTWATSSRSWGRSSTRWRRPGSPRWSTTAATRPSRRERTASPTSRP